MTKRNVAMLCGCIIAAGLIAGPVKEETVMLTPLSGTSTSYVQVVGWLQEIIIGVSGSGATGAVTVAICPPAENSSGPTTTILDVTASAGARYPVMQQAVGSNGSAISGVYGRYCLSGERLRITASNTGATNGVYKVTIKYERGK